MEQRRVCAALVGSLSQRLPALLAWCAARTACLAAQLYERGVPLDAVENALLWRWRAALARPADAPPLGMIRSLAYFSPVIEEVLETQPSLEYFQHLRSRLAKLPSNR